MNYKYIRSDRYDRYWKDSMQHQWGCLKEASSHEVFGDVNKKSRLETNEFLIDGEHQLPVEPCQKKIGFFDKVFGYMACTDEDEKAGLIRIVGRSQAKALITLLLALMILAAGIWGLSQIMKPADDTPIRIASGEMTNPNPANIRLPGIERIYVDAGKTHVKQQLLNVEGNAYNLQYTIELADTGEVLYKSKVIEPGYGVKEFDLNRTFEEGTYTIYITVNSSAQEDDQAQVDTAYNAGQIEAKLIVE